MAERERRIQEIAYLLWEGEGRPDGQADRFWHMAEAAYAVEAAISDENSAETLVVFESVEVPAAKKRAQKAKQEVEEVAKPKAVKPKAAKASEVEPAEATRVSATEPPKAADKAKAKKAK